MWVGYLFVKNLDTGPTSNTGECWSQVRCGECWSQVMCGVALGNVWDGDR